MENLRISTDDGLLSETQIRDRVARRSACDPFDSIEHCRYYDLDIRRALVVTRGQLVDLLRPHFTPEATILEVGCATGLASLEIAGRYPHVKCYGVEQNSHLCTIARENLALCNITNYNGSFEFEECQFSDLPIADRSVDVVFAFLVAHRIDCLQAVLLEMERIRKTNGAALLFDLARDAEQDAVAFISQYVQAGSFNYLNVEQFRDVLSRSYSLGELMELLRSSGLVDWKAKLEGINLIAGTGLTI